MIERRAPCSAASATARSTAARWPLTTICPGLLSLATAQTWLARRRRGDLARRGDVEAEQRRHRALADRHRLLHRPAAPLDEPRRLADRQARPPPPARNIRRANGRRHRRRAGRYRTRPPLSSTRITARLAANSAGCAFSVSVSSLSGPSNISRERCCDSASSTSSKSWRAAGKASASAWPMPGVCDPCPGKTKARFMCCCIPLRAPRDFSARHSARRGGRFKPLPRVVPPANSFAEAQIVALVFVIFEHLQQDAVARQRRPRLLNFFQGGIVIDHRLRTFRPAAAPLQPAAPPPAPTPLSPASPLSPARARCRSRKAGSRGDRLLVGTSGGPRTGYLPDNTAS